MVTDAGSSGLPPGTAQVVVDAQSALSDVLDAVRATLSGDAVILLLQPDVSAIDRAMIVAALGPLAIELAPRRVAAVEIVASASPERIDAAMRYLATAYSTTGQCLQVS